MHMPYVIIYAACLRNVWLESNHEEKKSENLIKYVDFLTDSWPMLFKDLILWKTKPNQSLRIVLDYRKVEKEGMSFQLLCMSFEEIMD